MERSVEYPHEIRTYSHLTDYDKTNHSKYTLHKDMIQSTKITNGENRESNISKEKRESRRRDLDPRPADYESAAPPAKLRRQIDIQQYSYEIKN